MRLAATLFWAVLLTLRVSGGYAADLTREEVQAALSTAPSGHGANFAGLRTRSSPVETTSVSNTALERSAWEKSAPMISAKFSLALGSRFAP